MLIGVISDTHGLLRPEALDALRGSELIVHAGGRPRILDTLRAIAPVTAVRGNVDQGAWADELPGSEWIEAAGASIYVLHDVNDSRFNPPEHGLSAVISGHSHKPSIRNEEGVLYLNPGSAGPRRFRLPITVARLRVSDRAIEAELVDLS